MKLRSKRQRISRLTQAKIYLKIRQVLVKLRYYASHDWRRQAPMDRNIKRNTVSNQTSSGAAALSSIAQRIKNSNSRMIDKLA